MNTIYFVRHALPDFTIHDDLSRPLIEEGKRASQRVAKLLENKGVTKFFSSPYVRSIETIKGLADQLEMEIEIVEDFRERKVSDQWIEDFNTFAKDQWEDFDYKLEKGETLREVQYRNIIALHDVLLKHEQETIVIGTHGTALSTILNYYDSSFGYERFKEIQGIMPWIVKIHFEGLDVVEIEHFYNI